MSSARRMITPLVTVALCLLLPAAAANASQLAPVCTSTFNAQQVVHIATEGRNGLHMCSIALLGNAWGMKSACMDCSEVAHHHMFYAFAGICFLGGSVLALVFFNCSAYS